MPPPVAPQVSLSGNSWEFSRTPTDRTSRIPHHRIRCSILLDCLIGFCAQCTNVHNQSHLESRASGRILPPLTPVTPIDVLTATTTTSNLAMVLEELQNVPGARRKRTRRGCRGGRGKKARCEEGRGGSSREERAPAKAVDAPRACPGGAPVGAVERLPAAGAVPSGVGAVNAPQRAPATAVDAPRACPGGAPAGSVERLDVLSIILGSDEDDEVRLCGA